MNGEPRTDLIQLITRTESLSGDDVSRARPADVDSSLICATTQEQTESGSLSAAMCLPNNGVAQWSSRP